MDTQKNIRGEKPQHPVEVLLILNGLALSYWIGWKPFTDAEKGLVRQRLFEFGEKLTEALRWQMPETSVWFLIAGYDTGVDMELRVSGPVYEDEELTERLEATKADLIESGIFRL